MACAPRSRDAGRRGPRRAEWVGPWRWRRVRTRAAAGRAGGYPRGRGRWRGRRGSLQPRARGCRTWGRGGVGVRAGVSVGVRVGLRVRPSAAALDAQVITHEALYVGQGALQRRIVGVVLGVRVELDAGPRAEGDRRDGGEGEEGDDRDGGQRLGRGRGRLGLGLGLGLGVGVGLEVGVGLGVGVGLETAGSAMSTPRLEPFLSSALSLALLIGGCTWPSSSP